MSMNKVSGSPLKAPGGVITNTNTSATTAGAFVPSLVVIDLPSAASSAEVDTNVDLLAKHVVVAASLLVTTAASSAATFSAGLLSTSSGGAAAGFLSGLVVDTTGIKVPSVTASTSGGSGGEYLSANSYGSFLSTFIAGSTATANDFGIWVPKNFAADSVTAKSVSYTVSSTGASALRGKLYLHVLDFTNN